MKITYNWETWIGLISELVIFGEKHDTVLELATGVDVEGVEDEGRVTYNVSAAHWKVKKIYILIIKIAGQLSRK